MRSVFMLAVFCSIFSAIACAAPDVENDTQLRNAIAEALSRKSSNKYAALIDYRRPSWEPRFHIVDRSSSSIVESFIVAHGIGSEGKSDDGIADIFSDVPDSKASSLGVFETGDTYLSQEKGHGLSMKLAGLSSTNRNARTRNIVIHANRYVEPQFIKQNRRPGRSWGCMVFSSADRDRVIQFLPKGSIIYAFTSNPN